MLYFDIASNEIWNINLSTAYKIQFNAYGYIVIDYKNKGFNMFCYISAKIWLSITNF